MESIRKWFYRPKRDDTSLLAQFFYADESLNSVACELDSFDGRQEPERCTTLVNQLRHCQDKVLTICNQIMDDLIPESRANRDFRVKFPDDVMQENLAGQLWFGAECLAAGSSIMNREAESSAMRPLAKALTKSLEIVRNLLREHALKGHMNLKYLFQTQNPIDPSVEKLVESLKIFDRLFADFELCYVGAMVPVKSTKEYEQQELVCVLFSETLQRALERGLLSQADVDNYEPALMFTIPRLAIVSGLLAPPGGPLCLNSADTISEMFRPFRTLLLKIRELLWTLNNRELYMLEKLLCSNEEPSTQTSTNRITATSTTTTTTTTATTLCQDIPDLEEFVNNFYTGYPNCKDFIVDFYTVTRNTGNNMDEVANDAVQILDQEEINDGMGNQSNAKEDDSVAGKNDRDKRDNETETGESSGHRQFENSERDENLNSSDINQIIEDSETMEIQQTQYLLNQVSHENITGETIHIQNSLPDLDSKKLISEANKTLSNLLLENECQNEISEQTDSGICTVISSENTSLYDKSPEEKKSFTNETSGGEEEQHEEDPDDNVQENTSYSCSNLNSPKRSSSTTRTITENSCVCKTLNENKRKSERISSNFDGTNEEFIGVAYGTGHLTVCDSNQQQQSHNFQLNYTENWENLNLNIPDSNSKECNRKEFWYDLKCENCPPSTSQTINQIGNKIEKLAKDKISVRKSTKEESKHLRRKHHRKYDRKTYGNCTVIQSTTSNESSRSNSVDRCLNPRITNYGGSLHPSQNTRQMPNFSSHSPNASPRMQHFEQRSSIGSQSLRNYSGTTWSSQSRKLLDHRRSRLEQIRSKKLRDSEKRKSNSSANVTTAMMTGCSNANSETLPNDGLGPRTDKSGLASPPRNSSLYETQRSNSNARHVDNHQSVVSRVGGHGSLDFVDTRRPEDSSSSCSSCCDSSSETSEFQSDCQDDEEIALAMQAAEIANRNQIRAKFRSSEDLVHRLFVCIAGVADQLQTNFASDLRNILKCVFLMNSSQTLEDEETKSETQVSSERSTNSTESSGNENLDRQDSIPEDEEELEEIISSERTSPVTERGEECVERAPAWIPDNDAPRCMACQAGFTVVRRRHHCRNCGKVFCGRCSSNNVPLPRYGHTKPVRVCNRCFLYQVTPFTVSQVTSR